MPEQRPHGRRSSATGDGRTDAVLSARGIRKSFGTRLPMSRRIDVLRGVDLEVGHDQVVGIVGANGSGKSTLMQIIVGALAADGGTVDVDGRIGWCPQERLLYERLHIDETFHLFGAAYGMSDDAIDEALHDLSERLRFADSCDRRIDHLSGGNQQKVNLAIALMHDPDVLLLDEPYTAFDWRTYQAFWELTAELRERGTAVLIISHLINERDRFDAIYELAEGELRRDDS